MSVSHPHHKALEQTPGDTYALRSNLNVYAFPSLCFAKLVRR